MLKRKWNIKEFNDFLKENEITDDFDIEIAIGSHKRFIHYDKILPCFLKGRKRLILQIFSFGEWKGTEKKPDNEDILEALEQIK